MKLIRSVLNRIRGEEDLNVLISRGLVVGENFRKNEKCIIDSSHCWLIEIGNNVVLAPRVHILAHDASMWNDTGLTKIAPVKIGDNVFLGAGSIIMPGVSIGSNSIVGAGSVVTKSFPDNSVIAGNPARLIGQQSEFINKHKQYQSHKPCYGEEYTLRNKNLSFDMKMKMKQSIEQSGFGYVE